MFDIDLGHYTEVVEKALALRPEIEAAVDKICEEGYSNIFFIGCGGTYAHSLPMMYWLDSTSSKVDAYSVIAAEFMAMGHKKFSKDSLCVFSTRSGNTKEIVAAAKFCKEAGARTLVYVSNDGKNYTRYTCIDDPEAVSYQLKGQKGLVYVKIRGYKLIGNTHYYGAYSGPAFVFI